MKHNKLYAVLRYYSVSLFTRLQLKQMKVHWT